MKKLFIWLLKHYSQTEKDRIEIIKILNENVCTEYSEQTPFGNVYNAYIEFILANSFITRCVNDNDINSLTVLKSGLNSSFDEAIKYSEIESKKPTIHRSKLKLGEVSPDVTHDMAVALHNSECDCNIPYIIKKPLGRIEKRTLFSLKYFSYSQWICCKCNWKSVIIYKRDV